MSTISIVLQPQESQKIEIVDHHGKLVMVVRATLIRDNYISADLTTCVGPHINVRAWDNGSPLRTSELNTQLQDRCVKGVTVYGVDDR